MTFLRFCAYFMHFFLIRKNKELSNCFSQCSMFCVLCERGQIFLALFPALHLMRKEPHKFISSQDVCMSTRKKMGVNIFLSINIRKNLEENWMWFGRYWFSFVFVIILFVDFVLFRWKSLVPCYRWEFSFSNFPRVITYNSFECERLALLPVYFLTNFSAPNHIKAKWAPRLFTSDQLLDQF